MASHRGDPAPHDPRVEEQIRDAVKQARSSGLGSYMSQQDLANLADARLTGIYGSGTSSAEFTTAIRDEVHRQTTQDVDMRHIGPVAREAPEPVTDQVAFVTRGPTAVPHDPVADLVTDHWFGDSEIYSLRGTAPYPSTLMEDRYDPSAPSDFYRGYVVALVAVVKTVGPAASLEHYQSQVNRLDEVTRTWTGLPDQTAGVSIALTNCDEYSNSGQPVATIVPFLREEIACIAECFYQARQQGR